MSLVQYLVGLQATFDTQALRPPAAAQAERARLQAQAPAVRALTAWCLAGAMPRMRQPLAVGALRGAVGAEAAALATWADAFAREIDGGIRLDAIFVDEGFGSLDPEALDHAIATLKDLQQSGRLVGIVSHVAELKEWIDARLELKATQSGSVARFAV